jgi:hypothetical protein
MKRKTTLAIHNLSLHLSLRMVLIPCCAIFINVEEYISPVAWHISVASHFCVTIDLSGINLFHDLNALLSLQQLSSASCNPISHPSTTPTKIKWQENGRSVGATTDTA